VSIRITSICKRAKFQIIFQTNQLWWEAREVALMMAALEAWAVEFLKAISIKTQW
jgi:hypothetical protein